MLDSTVDLLGNLFFAVLTLFIGSSVVGSIAAALWAVSRGSTAVASKKVNEAFCFAVPTRMTAPTISTTEGKRSEEMQYGWRRAQELERVGERRIGSKGSR
jgi:hypothetical protein